MRLPFPERIPLPFAVLAATVLAGLQQLQGTAPEFTIYAFIFIVLSAVTFNMAGGFTRPSGSYVFFYSVLAVILGLTTKAYLGEPADSNLRAPILTMQVYAGGMTAMLMAVLLSRRFTRKRALLGNILKFKDMRNATIGCMVTGLAIFIAQAVIPHQNGSFLTAIQQVNHFLPVAILLGTAHAIRSSNGKTALTPLVLFAMAANLAVGLTGFSKEAMLAPMLCWIIVACSLRLQVRPYQILTGSALIFLVFYYLFPFAQYGKNQMRPGQSLGQKIGITYDLITNPNQVRESYLQSQAEIDTSRGVSYFNTSQGFFDRLQMISPDDGLINYTAQGNVEGLSVIWTSFANWVPRILWPNKPIVGEGNVYAREVGGIVGEEDETTGISFSPTGEAYHLAGWYGVFVVAPILWTMLFTLFDSLCGDVRQSPWGALAFAMFAHLAPEGMLIGMIYTMWYGAIGIIFVAIVSAYWMPIIGSLIVGAERTGLIRTRKPGPFVSSSNLVPRARTARLRMP
jgi:hypothetical protein